LWIILAVIFNFDVQIDYLVVGERNNPFNLCFFLGSLFENKFIIIAII
jgi:hypothetical protein